MKGGHKRIRSSGSFFGYLASSWTAWNTLSPIYIYLKYIDTYMKENLTDQVFGHRLCTVLVFNKYNKAEPVS